MINFVKIQFIVLFTLIGCSQPKEKVQDSAVENSRPNVVIIYTDDQNFEEIGAYGGEVYTPNIDRLASEGALFTKGFVTSPICNPSRYGIMTGQFPSRTKHPGFLNSFGDTLQTEVNFNTRLNPGSPNLGLLLKNAGYKTGVVGKWDLGSPGTDSLGNPYFLPFKRGSAWINSPDTPDPKDPEFSNILKENHKRMSNYVKSLGFDYAEGLYNANPEMWGNHKLNVHNMEWVAEAAVNFIEQNKNNPFFLYMATTLHHIPHPQESLLQGDPRVTVAGYLEVPPNAGMPPRESILPRIKERGFASETAYCTWLDDGVGALIKTLEKNGILDNTIVIFMSDHQTNGKTALYEPGVNTPFVMRFPPLIKGGQKVTTMVQNLDMVPTILELCGVEKPNDFTMDGKSVVPFFRGEVSKIHDELFFEYGWTRAVRTENWRYLALRYSPDALKLKEKKGNIYHNRQLEPHQHGILLQHPNYWDEDQLYDINNDPRETTNLAYDDKYALVLDSMKTKLSVWLSTFGNHPFGEYNVK